MQNGIIQVKIFTHLIVIIIQLKSLYKVDRHDWKPVYLNQCLCIQLFIFSSFASFAMLEKMCHSSKLKEKLHIFILTCFFKRIECKNIGLLSLQKSGETFRLAEQ